MAKQKRIDSTLGNAILLTVLSMFIPLSLYLIWQQSYVFLGENILSPFSKNTTSVVLSLFTVVFLSFCLTYPLSIGKKTWYLTALPLSRPVPLSCAFGFFQSSSLFFKSLWFGTVKKLLQLLYIFTAFIPFLITITALGYLIFYSTYLDLIGLFLIIFTLISFVCGVFLCLSLYMNTFMFDYLFADNKNISLIYCIKQSKHLIKGRKSDIIRIHLSCWWVYLLCLTIIGGILYFPFLEQKLADYASKAIASKNK